MPFDGLMLAAVQTELNKTILGARMEKVYQPTKTDIIINLSRYRERYKLLMSAHPRDARIHLTFQSRENPSQPPTFCMVLRKHLEGGYIREIEQPGLERILKIHVDARDELGGPSHKQLIIEIMGKHSNILLVDPLNERVIDGIKRYSHELSRYREVLPGRPYISPPAQHKLHPFKVTEDEFRDILMGGSLDDKVFKVLQSNLEGFSTIMAREIVFRAQLPENLTLNYCGEHEMRVLWQALQSVIVPASKGEFIPTLIQDSNGKPLEFAAFDITRLEGYSRQYDDASRILDNYFTALRRLDLFRGEMQSLKTVISREIKRLEKKRALQTESANNAEKAEEYRIFGELITANIYRMKKCDKEVQLENFYDPEGKTVTIPLKAGLSPAENAQAYFKKYVKAKNTRQAAMEQARKSTEELNYLQGILLNIEQANSLSHLEEIRQELMEQGYVKDTGGKEFRKKKEKRKIVSSPLSYKSSDGFLILVGRNNKQNDRLTMKMAKDNDIWLHTKDIPGSHVIIKTEGSDVPNNTVYQAAVIAAYFSQARHSENVPVDYTRRKNVKKPRGAKPGYVIYEQQSTAVVTPDEELISSLALEQ